MRKYTVDQLLKMSRNYKTFKGLLKNRYLYYTLHNYGILKEATAHLKRKVPRRQFSKPVIDLAKIISVMKRYNNYKKFYQENGAIYMILRRNHVSQWELFHNKEDEGYVRSLLKQFGQEQMYNFLEK